MLEEVLSALLLQTSSSAGPMDPQCCRVALIFQNWCWSQEKRLPDWAHSSGYVSDSSPGLVSGVKSEKGKGAGSLTDSSHWCTQI